MKNPLLEIKAKIYRSENILSLVKKLRKQNKKIVFTNGVFDLVHPGHITYLSKAAQYGDILIVGLNSDSSVKRIKGENRPINNENNRQLLLASFLFTGAIVLFHEDTPAHLIDIIKPDVLIKGSDYKMEDIVGGPEVLSRGGEVKVIDFVEGLSSTAIIKKILDSNIIKN